MKRIPSASHVPASSRPEPVDRASAQRDLQLLDAFYHERAVDAAEAASWNPAVEQLERSEHQILFAELLALPTRRP